MIVLGAGIAGLSCAGELRRAGADVVVVDKGRGVGGRTATRRVDGQPIDHGLSFFHGSHPLFLEALERTDGTLLEGWPAEVHGSGSPCLPRAYESGERRVAFAEGVTAFPKSLASGLELRLETRASSLSLEASRILLALSDGSILETDTLVSTLPTEQAAALLGSLSGVREVDSLRALLRTTDTEPCLTAFATYPLEVEPPAWDILYPDSGGVLNLVSHDSAKRVDKKHHAFVFQCTPTFSRRQLEAEPEIWGARVLDEAATLLGGWAAHPREIHRHRWRYARTLAPNTLSSPVVVTLPEGPRMALAGEAFDPRGGVEGAFLSGARLAKMLLDA